MELEKKIEYLESLPNDYNPFTVLTEVIPKEVLPLLSIESEAALGRTNRYYSKTIIHDSQGDN